MTFTTEIQQRSEVDWISEVMEEVASKLNSDTYIDTLKSLSEKYPQCELEDTINISIKSMPKNYNV